MVTSLSFQEIIHWLEEEKIAFAAKPSIELPEVAGFVPASLKQLIPGGIYFVQEATQVNSFPITQSIILTNQNIETSNHLLVVDNPQLVHYKLSHRFVKHRVAGIHPTAIISPEAKIHSDVSIGPYCVLGACELHQGVTLMNHVVIEDQVTVGNNTFIDSHTVLGAGGLAWIWDEDGTRIMQPQLGGVVIGDDCILATDITVVKGSLSENTCIGNGTVIAHGTKIGHGSQIGQQVHMANNVSLAGNSVIGEFSFLGSACVVSSNVKIPPHTIVGASALVTKNFEEEYLTLAGVPANIIKRDNFKSKPHGAPQPQKRK